MGYLKTVPPDRSQANPDMAARGALRTQMPALIAQYRRDPECVPTLAARHGVPPEYLRRQLARALHV